MSRPSAPLSDIGVITACDPPFFPGFQMLYRSIKNVPVTLFDLALSPAQRAWCQERGIPLMCVALEVPKTVTGWQMWNKPVYLEQSPYERTLWLDCDCVVRGSLLPLFDAIVEKPLLLRHWDTHYVAPNNERLYERFPTRSRFATKRLINAGVLGIRKDRDLATAWFREWHAMMEKAAGDTDVQSLVSYGDEGALIWALEKTASVEIVTDHQEWNSFLHAGKISSLTQLASMMASMTDDVIWHVGCFPKVWMNHILPDLILSEEVLTPFDFSAYPHVWQKPEWTIDRRHIYWLYDLLTSGSLGTALEIGCLHGATSMTFVEALNRGKLYRATFCDIEVLPTLRRTLSFCREPQRTRIFEGTSVDLLDEGGSYDFVFIDGDHRLPAVAAELERLLHMQPKCIMAHDTIATAAGFCDCEGPAYLKQRLQLLGWFCLEDSLPRCGEKTHRGMFFATKDPALYEIARRSMVSRCGDLYAHLPESPGNFHKPLLPPPPPPPPPVSTPLVVTSLSLSQPTSWRQLACAAKHVVRAKVRKGWLW